VTAKLPERDGELSYHIRSHSEQHGRTAQESELIAVIENNGQETGASQAAVKGKRKR